MPVTLYASIRERQPGAEGSSREIHGEGGDYEAAKAAVDAQIPAGWQALGYSQWSGQPEHDTRV